MAVCEVNILEYGSARKVGEEWGTCWEVLNEEDVRV